MSLRTLCIVSALVVCLLAVPRSIRSEEPIPASPPVQAYPLPVCIVSGEHLVSGSIVPYVYQKEGQPDRLIRLCCHRCLARFQSDPERFLQKLDAAEGQLSGRRRMEAEAVAQPSSP